MTNHFPVDGKVGIISGGSQGLGLELAKLVAKKGASVIIVARTESRLKSAKKEIEAYASPLKEGQFVEYLSADLSDYDEACKVLPLLDELKVEHPDFLMCCAGAAYVDYFLNMSTQDLDSGIDLNYKTAIYLTQALKKRMIDQSAVAECQKDGAWGDFKRTAFPPNDKLRHIVLFSSTVAFYSFLGYAQYAPAKLAVKAFGDCIRHELKPYNVAVHTIFAGNFQSEGFEAENRYKPDATKVIEGLSPPIPAGDCAAIVLGRLEKGYIYVHTDLIGWVLNCFSLGFYPRAYSVVQVVVALFGALVSWLIDFVHQVYIQAYLRKEKGFDHGKKENGGENKLETEKKIEEVGESNAKLD